MVLLCLNLSGTYCRIIAFCLASLFLSPVITLLSIRRQYHYGDLSYFSYIEMYNICSLIVSFSAVLILEKTHCLEIIYDRLHYM